jgi:hypothetical protein
MCLLRDAGRRCGAFESEEKGCSDVRDAGRAVNSAGVRHKSRTACRLRSADRTPTRVVLRDRGRGSRLTAARSRQAADTRLSPSPTRAALASLPNMCLQQCFFLKLRAAVSREPDHATSLGAGKFSGHVSWPNVASRAATASRMPRYSGARRRSGAEPQGAPLRHHRKVRNASLAG